MNSKLKCIFLLLMSIFFIMGVGAVSAATWNVGSGAGNDTATIQGGIDMAGDGDTVIVHNKTNNYIENVKVNKSSINITAGSGEVVNVVPLTSPTTGTFYINNGVTAIHDVILQGFSISGATSARGIYIQNAMNCLIQNNIIFNNNYGITITDSSNNQIINNTITPAPSGSSRTGIQEGSFTGTTSGNQILNNNLSNLRYGIDILGMGSTVYPYTATNPILGGLISGNTITNSTYGVRIGYANNKVISNNIITNPTTTSLNGIAFDTSTYTTTNGLQILNNIITGMGNGILVYGSNFVISNNNITTRTIGANNGISVYLDPVVINMNNVINNNKITGGTTAASNYGLTLRTFSGFFPGNIPANNPTTLIYSNNINNFKAGIYFIGTGFAGSQYLLLNGIGTTQMYLNRIYGNVIGIAFQNSVVGTNNSGTITATNNWFGKNSTPTLSSAASEPTTTFDIWKQSGLGTLIYNPWIVLNLSASPSSIPNTHTSNIIADLTRNSDNVDTTTIYPGKYLPDGINTNFSSDSKGSVNPTSSSTTNGKSNTTFTANTPGVSVVSATVDAQTVNTNVNISPAVDLVVTKDVETFEPVWNYHDVQPFWITVSNNGPDDATLVSVEDILPAGLLFDHAVVSAGFFDDTTMTWYVGDLVNGGYETLELFVNVTGHNTIVNNTVNATSYETELNPDDNTASVLVAIPAAAHVNLTKEYINLLGNVITSSNYQQNFWALIKASNIGPDSTNVILEDVLNTFPFIQFATDQFGENFYASFDNGATWVPGSISGINFQDLTAYGNFFINNLASGNNVWLKVFLTTDFATGVVSNDATAYTSAYEYLTPGFASADLTVPPAADLSVTKWDDADYIGQPANYLDFVHYYIQIDNLGPDDATGVILNDLIPAGLVIDPFSVLASQGTFDPLTGIWTVTDGLSPTLGYGNSAFLSFLAQVVGTGAINNTVDVSATTYDPDTTNNNATDIINVPLAADIGVSKNFYYEDLGPIVFPDNPMDRYWKFFSEVIVTNNGPDTATNVKITDLLGPGMELAPFDPFGSWFVTYTNQNPDVDPPENNPSFDPLTMIWTIPAMNNGDIWVLDFFTIANTTGTVNNTATFDPTTADQYDWNSTNNVGFASTYVPTAQTQLTKWFQNDSTYGSPHTTTAYYHDNLYAFIKLYNTGPDTAKYITVIDDFTNDLIYNSALMETSYDGGVTWAIDPNATGSTSEHTPNSNGSQTT